MSYQGRRALSLLLFLLLVAMLHAQQSGQAGQSAPPHKEAAPRWTRYCLEAGGFCLEHPAGWKDLGAVYGGAGVVFAEPNKERAQTEWNHITAVALDLPESSPEQAKPGTTGEPEPATGNERLSLNELINRVMTPPEGATIQTLERMQTMVGGYPAQVVTAEVREQAKAIAIEQVAFIDADDVLYSVALRSAPADYRRLKPVFMQVLKSWSELPESAPQAGAPKSGTESPK
jgi:hypothetical protein